MWPTRDFDMLGQLAIVGATACGLFVAIVAMSGLVLLAGYVFRRVRHSRTGKP